MKENKKIKINKQFKEKGITLIALVVTIVILLILAGVTLNMAISQNGLFSRAKNSADQYKKAQKDEEELISNIGKEMYSEYVGKYVTGYTPDSKTFTIGTEISGADNEQQFTTEKVQWRIWDFDGTVLRLISEKPTQALTLQGATGYNNGVWAMNEVCRQCYGKNEPGITVANLRRSDIQKVSTYDYTTYSHDDSNYDEKPNGDGAIKFGSSKPYPTNNYYPEMWVKYDSKWTYKNDNGTITGEDKECLSWEQDNGYGIKSQSDILQGSASTEFKEAYYNHKYKKEEFINQDYYDLIFGNANLTWTSSRCLALGNTMAFGFMVISSGTYLGGGVYFSGNTVKRKTHNLRPMVSINLSTSGYKLEKIEGEDKSIQFKLTKSNE